MSLAYCSCFTLFEKQRLMGSRHPLGSALVPDKRCLALFWKKFSCQKSKQQLFIRDQYCHLAVMAPHSYCLFRLKWLDVTEPLISRQRLPNQPFYLFSANTPMIGLWSDLIGSFWLGPFVSVWNWKKNQSPGAVDLFKDYFFLFTISAYSSA